MYTIIKIENNNKQYLSRNSLKDFDVKDTAWFTNDLELAIRLLTKIKKFVDLTQCKICIEPFKIDQ